MNQSTNPPIHQPLLTPALQKNDRTARLLILTVSFVIFAAIVVLSRVQLKVDLGFNVHIFAAFNAVINSVVSVLLLLALWLVKRRQYTAHRNVMYAAMALSVLFLVSYIAHHLLAGETRFGDANHDGLVSAAELARVGSLRLVYFILLATHILLAAVILPFILFTAYRGMTGEYARHKKLSRYTWPLWLYVSLTGPLVYLLISPYYS